MMLQQLRLLLVAPTSLLYWTPQHSIYRPSHNFKFLPEYRSEASGGMEFLDKILNVQMAKRVQVMQEPTGIQFAPPGEQSDVVNLAHGFPDYPPPDFLLDALQDAITCNSLHQYTRGYGHPPLVNVLSQMYSRLIGRKIDPENEVLVTVGAIEALYTAFLGLVNPGEEVIIIEPFFPCYEHQILSAGGVPVFVSLRPNKKGLISSADWVLDPRELASKFNFQTKMILVNNPHNPLGKVFTQDELEMIAELCRKHNVICVMDEVYEWIVYDGIEHIRMNTLPGMWERTITLGSAGKAFGTTGWRVGWAYGPENLLKGLKMVHQNCIYTVSTLMQEAVAVGLEKQMGRTADPTGYWKNRQCHSLQKKRDFIYGFLGSLGVTATIPQGAYYIFCDLSNLASKLNVQGNEHEQHQLTEWLCRKKKLMATPGSVFYSEDAKPLAKDFIRICYAKESSTLLKAADILEGLKTILSGN
ncbi:kynurenine aminotransferase-like isoform X1 [Dermacentor silvarum]|uniref:kynurenine aminotransferase-like isoform X1 n=1 Tax=Dermacentor silvarum TaxID=543639 RepID=UPI00189B5B0A|nr:kynurenine aminotransferase-like isoform X1 [Dermacentor silvarum]